MESAGNARRHRSMSSEPSDGAVEHAPEDDACGSSGGGSSGGHASPHDVSPSPSARDHVDAHGACTTHRSARLAGVVTGGCAGGRLTERALCASCDTADTVTNHVAAAGAVLPAPVAAPVPSSNPGDGPDMTAAAMAIAGEDDTAAIEAELAAWTEQAAHLRHANQALRSRIAEHRSLLTLLTGQGFSQVPHWQPRSALATDSKDATGAGMDTSDSSGGSRGDGEARGYDSDDGG